jgi:TonB family protein
MSRLFLCASFSMSLVLAGALPAAAANEPRQLSPSSSWAINYAEDSCEILRTFGEGDELIAFILTRFEPGDEFKLTLVGRALRRARLARDVSLRFGPAENEHEFPFLMGRSDDLPAMFVGNGTRIAPHTPEEEDILEIRGNGDAHEYRELSEIATARYDAIEYLQIEANGAPSIRLEMEDFGAAFQASSQCLDELLTHWGIDVAQHRTLSRPVIPQGSQRQWIRPSDYPSRMLRRGEQAIVDFRLNVDTDGQVSGCHIQRSTQPVGFEEVVCDLLTRRARFEPALDSEGNPIASYYISTITFTFGR